MRSLLTFPVDKPPTWDIFKSIDARKIALERTRTTLKEHGVNFPDNVHPVVLTHKQFEWGGFKQDDNERIFQVPDVPTKLTPSLDLALYAIDVHICGM
jgi:hypothetical protein